MSSSSETPSQPHVPSASVRVSVRVRASSSYSSLHRPSLQAYASQRAITVGRPASAPAAGAQVRQFTYDNVLPGASGQEDLYMAVGAGMVPYVLDGYNATVLAYGQTGSGKTYTMGSEVGQEDPGMIPRFLDDLFAGMEEEGGFDVNATFLEVYGEDVVDLLSDRRDSLLLREDAEGVQVVGLSHRAVYGKDDALRVLKDGTVNRTTAATLMNTHSSRSHAVFSLVVTKRSMGQDGAGQPIRRSKLTFVDLAGSERMKKTGASGDTMKEGISINVGLLALGNVINALGLSKPHVPYRQSKLTRLLSDALGGNSMTHFVACVSPREEDVFETVSTLKYANRARDIVNAPIRGGATGAASREEVERLECLRRGLRCELVEVKKEFGRGWGAEKEWAEEAIKYLGEIEARAVKEFGSKDAIKWHDAAGRPGAPASSLHMPGKVGSSRSKVEDALDLAGDPEDDIKIIDQLLELQTTEDEYNKESGLAAEELDKVSDEIETKEKMLTKLRGNLVVYKNIKGKYNELLQNVESLENEKEALAAQLSAASKEGNPKSSKSAATIRQKLQTVEDSLARARSETRKQQQLCKAAEKEAEKARNFEAVVERLKSSKAALIKKQREAAARHRSYTESKGREIERLKKREKTATTTASKLKSECAKHVKALERRKGYCEKVRGKLRTTEQHLMRLLKMRRKELERKAKGKTTPVSVTSMPVVPAARAEEVKAIRYLISEAIARRIEDEEIREAYERAVQEYGALMKSLVTAVSAINDGEDNEETERDVEEIEMRLEIVGADMEELRERLGEELDDDSERDTFDTKTLQVIKDMVPDTARSVVLDVMESLTKAQKEANTSAKESDSLQIRSRELELENAKLKEQVVALADKASASPRANKESAESGKALEAMERKYHAISVELAEAKEKLSVVNVTKDVKKETADALAQLQTYWRLLGVEDEERENARLELENCVEAKCTQLLKDATKREHDTRKEILALNAVNTAMKKALGKVSGDEESGGKGPARLSLLKQKEEANRVFEEIEPLFIRAKSRREKIHNDAKDLLSSLERSKEEVSQKLKTFLAKSEDDEGALQENLLSSCETELRKMRVMKSELLVKSNSAYDKANRLAAETHSSSEELFQLAMSLTTGDPKKLVWFSPELCRQACDFVSSKNVRVPTNKLFGKHLELVAEGIEKIAGGREEFASTLKSVVEGAHRQLMSVVETDGEGDADEAYASFHKALFRLPKLSEDHIKACVNELGALAGAAEVMIQSETEALTVVWDALDISEDVRGDFWVNTGEVVKKFKADNDGSQFDSLGSGEKDGEQWLLEFIAQAKVRGRDLRHKMFKLELIHGEVSKNKSKQDAKNRIMSLDSEIRLIDAKLAAFEEKASSNKARLVSKKAQSANLLKEERYRKREKNSYISKLSKLKMELRDWEAREGQPFDISVLSEEVRAMMADGAEAEERTAFMHLRTVSSRRTSMMPVIQKSLDLTSAGVPGMGRKRSNSDGDVEAEEMGREVTSASVAAAVATATAGIEALINAPPPVAPKRQTRAASLATYKNKKQQIKEKEKQGVVKDKVSQKRVKGASGGAGVVVKKKGVEKAKARPRASIMPFGNLLNTPTKGVREDSEL